MINCSVCDGTYIDCAECGRTVPQGLAAILAKSFMDQQVGFTLWSKKGAQNTDDIMRICAQYILSELGELYTIEPLEWGGSDTGNSGAWVQSVVGYYAVYFCPDEGKYYWWTKSEIIEKHDMPCTSIEDGKTRAQEHYEKMLKSCLKEVTP